jgi:hypothetical protein
MTSTPVHRDRPGDDDPDGRYAFVDVRDLVPDNVDDVEFGEADDEPYEPAPRPRRSNSRTAPRRPAAKSKGTRRGGRRHRSGESAVGAIVCMIGIGLGAYWLTRDVMQQPREVCLVFSGLVAGLATWTPRAVAATRRGLAGWIAPKGGRR